jgi:preprotein translocase subunit SecG
MILLLTILFFIVALVQPGSSGGLGFLGGGSQSAFGTKTGNVMTKLTTVLAALFLIVSFVLGYLNARTSSVDPEELMEMKEASEEVPAEVETEPGFGEDIGVDISDTNE